MALEATGDRTTSYVQELGDYVPPHNITYSLGWLDYAQGWVNLHVLISLQMRSPTLEYSIQVLKAFEH